jgi:hypothetical protein
MNDIAAQNQRLFGYIPRLVSGLAEFPAGRAIQRAKSSPSFLRKNL